MKKLSVVSFGQFVKGLKALVDANIIEEEIAMKTMMRVAKENELPPIYL